MLEDIGEAAEADALFGEIGIAADDIGLEDGGVDALEAVVLIALKLGGEGRLPGIAAQGLAFLRAGSRSVGHQGNHHVVGIVADADGAKVRGQLSQQLAERGAAIGLFVKLRAQAQQHTFKLACIHFILLGFREDAFNQLAQRFLVLDVVLHGRFLGLGADLPPGADAFHKLELVAGVDKDGAGYLAAADAQHKLAHAFQRAHQRHIVAVARYDAEAVDQRVGIGGFQRVDDQLDIGVVFLRRPVAQRGDDHEGVGKQNFLQIAEAVGVAVDLAKQDIAADLDLFENVV